MVQIIPTSQKLKLHLYFLSFISHMVQIIPILKTLAVFQGKSFISHMVQIILRECLGLPIYITSFISHMVQIIQSSYIFVIRPLTQLYIPHGSDNTKWGYMLLLHRNSFISHMVQIILYLALKLRFLDFSLYPTWFR